MVGANIEIYNGRSTIIGFVLSMFNPIFIKQQELKLFAWALNIVQTFFKEFTHTHTQHLC